MATLYYLNQYFTTTLSKAGGMDASETTGIVAQAISGVDETKAGVACVNWADPLVTSTAEWFTYTSINSTTKEFNGVIRGAEGYAAKAHDNGAVIAFPISESHINNINAKIAGDDDGVTLDTPTLTTPVTAGGTITSGITKPAVTAVTGATPELDLDVGNEFSLTLSEAATFTVENEDAGQCFLLQITQDSGANEYAVTWPSTVHWVDGTAPTMSTGANEVDLLGFRVTAADTYQGFVIGQALATV